MVYRRPTGRGVVNCNNSDRTEEDRDPRQQNVFGFINFILVFKAKKKIKVNFDVTFCEQTNKIY